MLEIETYAVDNDYCSSDCVIDRPALYSITYKNGATVTYTLDEFIGEINIEAIKVQEDYQGKGIGTEIVRSILDKYESYSFYLNADTGKTSWWERLGFEVINGDEYYTFMYRP